jgi:hypothetical protein
MPGSNNSRSSRYKLRHSLANVKSLATNPAVNESITVQPSVKDWLYLDDRQRQPSMDRSALPH